MADNTDARAVRTRTKLLAAFHELVRDTGTPEVSVSALTRAAGVNRTSFYEHYASPDDVAVDALSELFEVVGSKDMLLRSAGGVSAEEASRRALRELVDFVWVRRASYAPLLGPAAPTRIAVAVTEAFTSHATVTLERLDRPPGADPRLTARFIAGGVLSVVGGWLADPPGRWSRERLVTALVQCLPAWVVTD